MDLNQIVLLEAQVNFSERFSKALLNTAMGITIVFLVLILISLIISCFKYINILEQKIKSKKETVAVSPVDHVIEQIAQREEENLADDLELTAVITAAIQAYEEENGNQVSADGLFVRSIRKTNKKWKNAE